MAVLDGRGLSRRAVERVADRRLLRRARALRPLAEPATPTLAVSTTDAPALPSPATYPTWVNGVGPSPNFRSAGGPVRQRTGAFPGRDEATGAVVTDGSGVKSGPTAHEWVTDAPVQEIVLRHGGGAPGIAPAARLWVDGVPVSADPFTANFATAGTARYVTVDLSAAPRRFRLFRLETLGSTAFAGVRCAAGDTVLPAPAPGGPRAVFLGDSFVEGAVASTYDATSGGPSAPYQGWAAGCAALMGWDAVLSGAGGTGYLNPNAGAGRARLRDRMLAGDLPPDFDAVVIAMGVNDSAAYAAADVVAEARACWALARGTGAALLVVGPWFVTPSPTAALIALNDALRAAAEEDGVPYVDVRGWITAANTGSLTAADNGHPTRRGHDHYAWRLASEFRRRL